ncbi:MAG: hypothetical protein B6I38_01820 [Anaerolineaceae bacterium 4572_5.1]|nr:MAG: hypothetical protein B6I38_01820 [Anaerolineaceae bacterium 4572_5.1]
MDGNLPEFLESFPYDKTNIGCMGEDVLTVALVFFLINRSKNLNFVFMPQVPQKGRRTVDIGVFLFGSDANCIFCIEAKFLPHSPFDYVTGEYAAIKRFKAMEHGLKNSVDKIPLPQNGIIAYVKSGAFKEHLGKINKTIQGLSNTHFQAPDEFKLTWAKSEQLDEVYFNSIGRLYSKHPRQKTSDISLHHFWIHVS